MTATAAGGHLDRARGTFLGLAVGDALGTTLEFSRPPAPPFPTLAAGPHREMTGGGPFHVAPGQVTDDTQMACCLAASLWERRALDVEDVARRYVAWWAHAFDVGGQTKAVLKLIAAGTPALEAGRQVWERSGRKAAGNGSLMRCAPIGVCFGADAAARRRASLDDSAITHADPRCQLAGAAFNAALAAAVTSDGDPAPFAMHAAAVAEVPAAAAALAAGGRFRADEVDDASQALLSDLAAATQADPYLYGPELHLFDHEGFVRVAFRLAFWTLLHAPSFAAALIDVVNRGGDADTNGAIAGALLGARFGADAIPARWRDAVLGALQDLPPGPLRDDYHPKVLLSLSA